MRIVDAETARALDADAMRPPGLPGLVLMERAALGTVRELLRRRPDPGPTLVLAGSGNNGGDGIAVARMLACAGHETTIVLVGERARMTDDAAAQLAFAERIGVPIVAFTLDTVRDLLCAHPIWVDALTGIGARPPLRGAIADVVALASRLRREVLAFVVAVDVPSGACASTGAIDERAIPADLTVTYGATRWAHWLPPAMAACGDVHLVDIGLVPSSLASAPGADVLDACDVARWVPPFAPDTHKGRQGRVAIVAGSPAMPGAAVLAARSALAVGAGLVTLSSCAEARAAVIAHAPEVMTRSCEALPAVADAWLVGPGLGIDDDARDRFEAALVARGTAPAVIDADGLNLLAKAPRTFDAPTVLTPHPAELARLLDCATADVVASLPDAARRAADRYAAIVVAKTAGAFVCGGGRDCFVAPGSPGLATAGSGDVLAGAIAGLAPRTGASEAARAGAWLHAAAGRAAARRLGAEALVASSLIDALPRAFDELRRA